MLKNTLINRKATLKVARALDTLNRDVVYVGGAMVSLYINDPAAEDIRPTKDIDLTFNITTNGQLETLRQNLTKRGFIQTHKDNVICRFRFEEIMIDVMSTSAVGWAPSNRWFLPGFEKSFEYSIDDQVIRLMPLAYFLGSKIEAFFDRGISDPIMSQDLEDIVYLINYTSDIADKIVSAEENIRFFLRSKLHLMINDRNILNAIEGHLYFEEVDERMEIIRNRMSKAISNSH